MASPEGESESFPRHEYDAIEKAVMESARGRWFLREYARRNRAADTLTLLEAIGRLHAALAGQSGRLGAAGDMIALAERMRATRSELARMADQPEEGTAIYTWIAEQAMAAAERILKGSERVARLAREAANSNAATSDVAASAESLVDVASSQESLARQIASAMGLLSEVDAHVSSLAGLSAPPAIEPRQLQYFMGEEDLFDPNRPPERSVRSSEERQRVIVIRKPKSDAVEIPLAGEIPEQVA
jgi:AraC-like DNA-binding protein